MYGTQNTKPLDITFDWLFDRISQEDVYIKYFGFCKLNTKFCNPLRKDSKPDCSFFWKEGILYFNDIADKKIYTCVSIVMQIEKLTYTQSLLKIYDIFLKSVPHSKIVVNTERKIITKEYKDIQCKIQNFTTTDREYLKSYGITLDNCKKFKIFSIKNYWINGDIKYSYNSYNPCLGYYDNGKWKLYFYKASDYRFLTNIPQTELQGYDELPWVGDLLIITKSLKDVTVWYNLGFNAVAPHSEGIGDWMEKIPTLQRRFSRIILNFDNDKAGIKASQEIKKLYDFNEFYLPEEKDISGYYRKYGLQKTKQLTEDI